MSMDWQPVVLMPCLLLIIDVSITTREWNTWPSQKINNIQKHWLDELVPLGRKDPFLCTSLWHKEVMFPLEGLFPSEAWAHHVRAWDEWAQALQWWAQAAAPTTLKLPRMKLHLTIFKPLVLMLMGEVHLTMRQHKVSSMPRRGQTATRAKWIMCCSTPPPIRVVTRKNTLTGRRQATLKKKKSISDYRDNPPKRSTEKRKNPSSNKKADSRTQRPSKKQQQQSSNTKEGGSFF